MRTLADRSPFNPNFGKVPRLFLDRENIIDDYIDELTNSGDHIDTPYQTTMIYGVRGFWEDINVNGYHQSCKTTR